MKVLVNLAYIGEAMRLCVRDGEGMLERCEEGETGDVADR